MKKLIITTLAVVCIITTVKAQEDDATSNTLSERKHEIRIDATEIVIIPTLEINYEYVLGQYAGIGAALSVTLDNSEDLYYGQKFAFTPFYRQYFLNKKDSGARGLFVEGMMQMAGGEHNDYYYEGSSNPNDPYFEETIVSEDWFTAGAGFAVGQKWLSNNGFVFEISAGGGRYFGGGENQPGGFFRGGLLVGYRF